MAKSTKPKTLAQEREAKQLEELKSLVWQYGKNNPSFDWMLFNVTLKRMKKEGYKVPAITYTIRYMIEHKGVQFDGMLGLVPYYYGEAERYCKWRQAMATKIAKSHYGVGITQIIDRQDIKQEECVFD